MANKHRPKKSRAPYRKYLAGEGFVHTRGLEGCESDSQNRVDESTTEDEKRQSYNGSYCELIRLTDSHLVPVKSTTSNEMRLPWELQFAVMKQCEFFEPQFLRVCKSWYIIGIPMLYRVPALSSKNFHLFIESFASTSKKHLGKYVVNLDLSPIIQSGKNSYVAKLLRRCSSSLEFFTAPQTSFGIAPMISLKSCNRLRYLDLGLLSETVHLKRLFEAIQGFPHLTHLSFPRSSIECDGFREMEWPKNLQYLKLSGGITNEFVCETIFPASIITLEFSYCPQINEYSIYTVLSRIGDNLRHLRFQYPMPSLSENSLDFVFRYSYNLTTLQLVVDYSSKWAFSENILLPLYPKRPLRVLVLETSGSLGQSFKIHPDDITIALAEGRLPCLRTLRISSKLGWDPNSSDVEDLLSVLEEQGGDMYVSH